MGETKEDRIAGFDSVPTRRPRLPCSPFPPPFPAPIRRSLAGATAKTLARGHPNRNTSPRA